MTTTQNKRIAKNTLYLYIRMFFTLIVSLYTSRVILDVLGVEDFGIYGIVGGFVGLFSFINASMSGATSRFLTYELGVGDVNKVKNVFSTSIFVHIGIALLVLIILETIGLWYFETQLILPNDRLFAARLVYQFSIFTSLFSIVRIPYMALIIAYEKMNIYAYLEIANVFFKLIVVYLLLLSDIDKLVLYAVLMLVITVIITGCYIIYCNTSIFKSKVKFVYQRELVYPILSFSGWDLFGNMSVVARTQGVNVLLNLFFGPLLNAAYTISSQVQSAVAMFGYNVVTAVRPQIVKSYATKDYQRMNSLIIYASKFVYILLLILSIPLIVETDFILKLWLKNVPDYTVIFCKYTLLFNFFATVSTVLVSAIHATGNIKRLSLINGLLYLMVLPFSYIAYKVGSGPAIAFLLNIIFAFCGMLFNIYTLKIYIKEFPVKQFVFRVLLFCFFVTLVSYFSVKPILNILSEGFLRFLSVCILSTFVILFLTYLIGLNKEQRSYINNIIYKKNGKSS